MDDYNFPQFTDTSSFYDHRQQEPQSANDSNPYFDFITANMPNSMVRSSANATTRSQDQAFPPVDSILYSPSNDWTQFPDYITGSDAFGLQSLFDESPLMSTLERRSSGGSLTNNNLSTSLASQSTSPAHEHIDVDGWEPASESKRSRPANKTDSKSACWTSPLCPAHGKPGPHPNPSTCEGGCAPNVFDDRAMDQWFEDMGKSIANDGAGLLGTQMTTTDTDLSDVATTGQMDVSRTDLPPAIKEEEAETEEVLPRTRQKKRSNKRASSEESSTPSPVAASATAKLSRRQPHNEIEKKYRESINTHLEALKNSVPAFQQTPSQCIQGKGDIEDLAAAPKPSKSIILASAVAHIKKIEREKKQFEQERNLLRQQVKALQALMKCDDCSLMQYVLNLNLGSAPNAGCRGVPRMS
jgi:hypothetical protein